MTCKLCGSKNVGIVWNAPIRRGGIGDFTEKEIHMYKCEDCGVVWHEPIVDDIGKYYESNTYRDSVDGDHDIDAFYNKHDYEVLNRLEYTGTTLFRNKSVADIGCAAGTFLDYLNGVAKEIIAIEPSEYYRGILKKKGYETYPYAKNCIAERHEKLDVVVSFSVLEHVEDPHGFMTDVYNMLKEGGEAIIGTPSDAPLMCDILGDSIYEREVLYSVQHLFVFSKESIVKLCQNLGFRDVRVETYQRYSLSNFMGWLKNKAPRNVVGEKLFDGTMDAVFKAKVRELGMGDYIVAYLKK